MKEKGWVTQLLIVLFVVPLVIEGVLMESMLGMYLLNNFPAVFHALNIIALAMFGIVAVAIVGEMIFRRGGG
jgi:hypothetical protein